MTTPAEQRQRALNIREASLGFNDAIAHTLAELAERLEAEAAEMEANEAELGEMLNSGKKDPPPAR